jgi:outer membrane protein assembly factor BamC
MKLTLVLPLLSALALTGLTGCGYIKSLFPDKEKDYQYTVEIPPLVLPADLAKNDGLKRPAPAVPMTPGTAETSANAVTPGSNSANEVPELVAPAPNALEPLPAASEEPITVSTSTDSKSSQHEQIPVTLLKTADGIDTLRLSAPFENAWRAVDKALSRKSVEVTNRNKAEKQFTLHYDPDEKALEDRSFWQEAFFIFHGLNGNEQEFIVKLNDHNGQTDAVILDKDQKPTADASALKLLKLLQDTIQSGFNK